MLAASWLLRSVSRRNIRSVPLRACSRKRWSVTYHYVQATCTTFSASLHMSQSVQQCLLSKVNVFRCLNPRVYCKGLLPSPKLPGCALQSLHRALWGHDVIFPVAWGFNISAFCDFIAKVRSAGSELAATEQPKIIA